MEKNASPHTIDRYGSEIRECLTFLESQGVRDWPDVDRDVLRRYLAWLSSRGLVKASIARRLSELRSFGRFLVREDVIGVNPFLAVSSPKVPKRLPVPLSVPETVALLGAPDTSTPQGLRDSAILEVLYSGGLRVSELTGLNLGHVDARRSELCVWGKGAKERIALLGKPALVALQTYIEHGRPELLQCRTTSALFLNRSGGRLSTRSVMNTVRKYSRAAGLQKRVTPHTLRHSFATHLLDGGADLRCVQELLGHERLTTTQVYTHVSQSRAREVYLGSHPLAERKAMTGGGRVAEMSVRFPSAGQTACQLEGLVGAPCDGETHPAAVLCHPGAQGQAGMEYPIIAACAAGLREVGFITLRFNFRGVQASEGDRSGGLHEPYDVQGAVAFLRERSDVDSSRLYLVGDSFGAQMVLDAARADQQVAGIICIVLPLGLMPAEPRHLQYDHRPKLFIVAERDQFCDVEAFMALCRGWAAPKDVVMLGGTDHFLGIGPSDDPVDRSEEISGVVVSWLARVSTATRCARGVGSDGTGLTDETIYPKEEEPCD